MPTPHPLIARLERERRHRGISARRIAEAAGVSHDSVALWERGAVTPLTTGLEAYAAVLGYELTFTRKPAPTRARTTTTTRNGTR